MISPYIEFRMMKGKITPWYIIEIKYYVIDIFSQILVSLYTCFVT